MISTGSGLSIFLPNLSGFFVRTKIGANFLTKVESLAELGEASVSDGLKTTDTMIPSPDRYSPILGIGLFLKTILSTQVSIFVTMSLLGREATREMNREF